jgi:hypothetical protein
MNTDPEIVKAISVKFWMPVIDHRSKQRLYQATKEESRVQLNC